LTIRQTLASRSLDGNLNAIKLFRQRPFYLAHIVVTNRISLAVVPFDSDFAPRRADNDTKISGRCGPADLIAYFEKSGLLADHLRFTCKFDSLHASVARKAFVPVAPRDGDVSRFNR